MYFQCRIYLLFGVKLTLKSGWNSYLVLHILLLIYSLTGVCSKLAGRSVFLSPSFFLWYGTMIFIMAIYAVGWQQILKRLPLSTAFANKAATLVWSVVFGVLFFQEQLKLNQIVGCIVAVTGVVIFMLPGKEEKKDDE